jgi:membrane protease YdiL (CAAX protease family)
MFLRLDANQYLLIGVPLTAVFQIFVRKQPIRALWIREAPRFALDRKGWIWAIVLAITPAQLIASGIAKGNYTVALWGVSAACGAMAAAYAIRNLRRETVRHLLLCAAVAGSIGVAIMVGAFHLRHGETPLSFMTMLQTFGGSSLGYFPVSFILEEVSFRGALDSHLHHPGESRSWTSALLVSALWGLWHFPIVPGEHAFAKVASLIFVHCVIGVPLSFFWRKSGNLAVTAFSHALIDGVRNALLL